MPKGPRGEKRPADVIGGAVRTMKILTGEIEEKVGDERKGRPGGLKGGEARATKLTEEKRREIAKRAAKARWSKTK
jgi:hypothetical protein